MPQTKTNVKVDERPTGSIIMITTPNGSRYRVVVSGGTDSIVVLAMNGRIGVHPNSMNEIIISTH